MRSILLQSLRSFTKASVHAIHDSAPAYALLTTIDE